MLKRHWASPSPHPGSHRLVSPMRRTAAATRPSLLGMVPSSQITARALADWQANSAAERGFPDAIAIASLRIESPGNDTSLDLNGCRTRDRHLRSQPHRGLHLRQWPGCASASVERTSPTSALRWRPRSRARNQRYHLRHRGQREGQTILDLKGLTPKTTATFPPPE